MSNMEEETNKTEVSENSAESDSATTDPNPEPDPSPSPEPSPEPELNPESEPNPEPAPKDTANAETESEAGVAQPPHPSDTEQKTGKYQQGEAQTDARQKNKLFRTKGDLGTGLFIGSILIFLIAMAASLYLFWTGYGGTITQTLASPSLTTFALLMCLIANLALVGFVYASYKWRTILTESGRVSLVPEAWGYELQQVGKKADRVSRSLAENTKTQDMRLSKYNGRLNEMFDSLEIFQNAIRQRDEEIIKLQKGYDRSILSRYLNRVIRLHEDATEIMHENPDSDDIRYLQKLTDVFLEDCDISKVEPKIGSDWTKEGKLIDDNVKYEDSDDPKCHHKIFKVDSPAYIHDEEGVNELIRPARVQVYRKPSTNREDSAS